jgi:hypothetical protein
MKQYNITTMLDFYLMSIADFLHPNNGGRSVESALYPSIDTLSLQ